jgi:hypothetical protein
LLDARGDEAAHARRAREAEPATARKVDPDRDRSDPSALTKGAHGRMGLRGSLVRVGSHVQIHIECDRDRVERRTEVRRRRGNPNDPVVALTSETGDSTHHLSLARNSVERALPSRL